MRSLLYSAVMASLTPMAAAGQAAEPPAPQAIAAPAPTLPVKHAPTRTASDISARDLMSRLYILADDSMMGREAGTAGNVKGTDYIAAEVKRLGLKPAGDSGTFFQTVPLKIRSVDSVSSLTAGGTAVAYGTEWAGRATGSFTKPDLPVVYGGQLGDSTAVLTDSLAAGKLVVYVLPDGAGGMRALRSATRLAPSAAAVAVVAPDQFLGFFRRPSTFVDDPDAPGPSGRPTMFLTRSGAAKLFDAPLEQLTPG